MPFTKEILSIDCTWPMLTTTERISPWNCHLKSLNFAFYGKYWQCTNLFWKKGVTKYIINNLTTWSKMVMSRSHVAKGTGAWRVQDLGFHLTCEFCGVLAPKIFKTTIWQPLPHQDFFWRVIFSWNEVYQLKIYKINPVKVKMKPEIQNRVEPLQDLRLWPMTYLQNTPIWTPGF